jgi:hypothetical protein
MEDIIMIVPDIIFHLHIISMVLIQMLFNYNYRYLMLIYKIIKTDAIDAQTVNIYIINPSRYYSIHSFFPQQNIINHQRRRRPSKIYHQLNYTQKIYTLAPFLQQFYHSNSISIKRYAFSNN